MSDGEEDLHASAAIGFRGFAAATAAAAGGALITSLGLVYLDMESIMVWTDYLS